MWDSAKAVLDWIKGVTFIVEENHGRYPNNKWVVSQLKGLEKPFATESMAREAADVWFHPDNEERTWRIRRVTA